MDLEPFESPKLLVEGAKESIDEFEAACQAFVESEPYRVVEQIEAQTGHKLIKLRFDGGFPPKLRLVAYRIVNDLRHALDHAMCDGASQLGKEDVRRVHFPMGQNLDDLAGEIKRHCRGVDADLITFVRNFEPYYGGNNELWALGRMAGPNKHQRVLAIGRGTSSMSIGAADDGGMTLSGGLEFGAHWNSFRNELQVLRLGPEAVVTNVKLGVAPAVVLGAVDVFSEQPAAASFRKLAGIVEGIVLGIEAETARLLRERPA